LKCFIIKIAGIASFAQERIFLDEQVRFSNKVAIYNELITLRVVDGSLSVNHLLCAVRYVLNKHKILRTSLIFNNVDGILKQCITDNHQTFILADEKTFKHETELIDIIYQTTIHPNLFDLSKGRVFQCQIVRQQKLPNENNDNDLITYGDVLIIAFHHVAFDRSSRQIFFNDLCSAYNSNTTISDDQQLLQYIDYSVHERVIDITSSREFWRLQLEGYIHKRRLLLPVDRHRSSTDQLSGLASVVQISFNNEVSASFFEYASVHQITPFQLGLATFYAFLFKLAHGQHDVCISSLNANRYRTELQDMIGMFVTTLPYRIQLDSHWSFDELVKHVREKCLSILEYSNYPLQNILADSHLNQPNVSFLETIFDFIIASSDANQLPFNDASVEQISFQQISEVAKFDSMLAFFHDPTLDDNQLSCHFICSHDLVDETTLAQIAQRFQYLFEQLFRTPSSLCLMDKSITPINKLTLILPEEAEEVFFRRLENIVNEGMRINIIFNALILI
jgi:hypothetical protein